MAKETILVVEDDLNIAELLVFYLTTLGYAVRATAYGNEALRICREEPPDLLLLDVQLPDMSGYDVGRALRRNPATRDMPIIVLTAFNERQDRIIALGEIKAQYFVGKPFDLEEVATIIRNQLDENQRRGQIHPVTGLPTAELVNAELRRLLVSSGWTLALIRVNGFETFTQSYGVLVGEEVLNYTALMLTDAVRELGGGGDFLGQMVVGPYFLVVSSPERLQGMCNQLIARFDDDIALHYSYQDRKQSAQGGPESPPLALMSIAVGLLSSSDGPFHDVRHLSEAAESVCQRAVQLANAAGRRSYIATAQPA